MTHQSAKQIALGTVRRWRDLARGWEPVPPSPAVTCQPILLPWSKIVFFIIVEMLATGGIALFVQLSSDKFERVRWQFVIIPMILVLGLALRPRNGSRL